MAQLMPSEPPRRVHFAPKSDFHGFWPIWRDRTKLTNELQENQNYKISKVDEHSENQDSRTLESII